MNAIAHMAAALTADPTQKAKPHRSISRRGGVPLTRRVHAYLAEHGHVTHKQLADAFPHVSHSRLVEVLHDIGAVREVSWRPPQK